MFEHLVSDLRVQVDGAVLELVERRVELFVDVEELVVHSFDFELVLGFAFLEAIDLLLHLIQVALPPLHVLLRFHEEDLLPLVVLFHSLLQCVFSVLEHLDHQLKFLIKFADCIILLLLQLLFDFKHVLLEHLSLVDTGIYLLHERVLLLDEWVNLLQVFNRLVADVVALVISDHALRTDVNLIIFAEIFSLLLRVGKAELVEEVIFHLLVALDLRCSNLVLTNSVHAWADTSVLINFLLVIDVI